ncbi:MAG: agarase [Bacteroidota bacterium]|nr:agarase [Bacteroidota bacterium]
MKIKIASALIFLITFGITQAQQSGHYSSVNVEARTRSHDKSTNSFWGPWKSYETRLIDNFTDFKPDLNFNMDKYGNDETSTYKATGYFHAEKINGRWWVIDPLGHPGLHVAVNTVSQGKSKRNQEALEQKFNNTENWINQTHNEIINLGFNGTGSWSDIKAIVKSNNKTSKVLSYTINLDFMSGYGNKRGGTYQVPGHKGYPNNVIFVFDPDFEKYCNEEAKKLVAYKNDPNLFGYFSDNEMPFSLKNLEGYLNLPEKDLGHQAAQAWMDKKGITKEQINDSIREEFLGYVAERYFSIVSKAIKKYDPHHIYLGARLYGSERNVPAFMKAAGSYVDILSINYYGTWTPSQKIMLQWSEFSGKPFIITEFYTKGEDSKLGNTSGAGWEVKTQEDRGKAYQNFCLGLLESKNCVGWHWFKYMDNDPTEANAEPSNTDANKGIVDNYYNLYRPLTNAMKQLNLNRFALIKYFDGLNSK